MRTGEGRFVDANVLVYSAQTTDPRYAACLKLLRTPVAGPLSVSQQILAEFYSTITSRKRVNDPLNSGEAIEFIETLLGYEHIILLPISTNVSALWISLLKRTELRGPRIFDFQIAATMPAHGVTKLITYNGRDFIGNPEIEILEPELATGTQ
jgi:predicted nucleic acid-binding protein